MKTLTRILTLIYFLAGLVYILTESSSETLIRHVLKGSLIPFLIIIFVAGVKNNLKGTDLLFAAGLFFSWAGDIALDFAFIPGLLCFLLAHIMYLSSFFLTPGKGVIFGERAFLLIPVILFGIVLIYIMFDDLAEMKAPVMIYAMVILAMLASAIDRLRKVNLMSFRLVLAGAILFVISDSAIAVNKFTWDFNYSGPVIMSTYLVAQYLLVKGFLLGRVQKS